MIREITMPDTSLKSCSKSTGKRFFLQSIASYINEQWTYKYGLLSEVTFFIQFQHQNGFILNTDK